MAKGHKTGGRQPDARNKVTIERELRAAAALDQARANPAKKLAVDVLDDLMQVSTAAMAAYQAVSAEQARMALAADPNTKIRAQPGDVEKFGQWWDRTLYAAKELARYQSPTMKAVQVTVQGQTQEALPPPDRENVVYIKDPIASARFYQRIMQGRG